MGLLFVPQTVFLMQAPLSPDVLNTWCKDRKREQSVRNKEDMRKEK